MPSDDSKEKIKKLLAEAIGVEPEDIKNEDSLIHELHMSPADLAEFSEILQNSGFKITPGDLAEIETFEDLTEFAAAHEEIK